MAEQSHITVTPAAHRRGFLTGVFAASAFAATPALAAIPSAPAEHPELLAVHARLTPAIAAFDAAEATLAEAKAAYARLRPEPPKEILEDRRLLPFSVTEVVHDLDGRPWLGADGVEKRVYISRIIKSEILLQEIPRTTKRGRQLRRVVRVAKDYEDKTAAAERASNYDLRHEQSIAAALNVVNLTSELMQHEPTTSAGLVAFARAAMAVGRAGGAMGYHTPIAQKAQIDERIIASVLRLHGAMEAANG